MLLHHDVFIIISMYVLIQLAGILLRSFEPHLYYYFFICFKEFAHAMIWAQITFYCKLFNQECSLINRLIQDFIDYLYLSEFSQFVSLNVCNICRDVSFEFFYCYFCALLPCCSICKDHSFFPKETAMASLIFLCCFSVLSLIDFWSYYFIPSACFGYNFASYSSFLRCILIYLKL